MTTTPLPTSPFEQCLHISALHARLQLALDDALGTFHGLSYADFLLLRQIDLAGDTPLAVADLVPCLGVPLSAVVRRILPLEKTGLVQRQDTDGARDGRTVRLRPAARQVLANATETARAVCSRLDAIAGHDAWQHPPGPTVAA